MVPAVLVVQYYQLADVIRPDLVQLPQLAELTGNCRGTVEDSTINYKNRVFR
jgi:hypothetical protein